MSIRHVKLNIFVYIILALFLGLGLGFLGGLAVGRITMLANTNNSSEGSLARKSLTITIDPSQRDVLFAQTRKFADKWRYAIRIAPTVEGYADFDVAMWRDDMKIFGLYKNDTGELIIAFSYTDPTRPVPDRYFDQEIDDLKSFINQIPNVRITEEG